LVTPDRGRQTYLSRDRFRHFHDIAATEGEARLQRRREAKNVSTIVSTLTYLWQNAPMGRSAKTADYTAETL
jgi:hypothetical protein